MKTQLYTKNEKGRYVPYIPDETDNKLYRKLGNTYKPVSMDISHDTLREGVWVVKKYKYGKGLTCAEYLREQFGLEKIADLTKPDLGMKFSTAELGYIDKVIDGMLTSCSRDNKSIDTIIKEVVMKTINVLQDDKEYEY